LKTRRTLLLGLLLSAAAGCGAPEFKEFRSDEGRFSVQLPGVPREETRETKNGKLHLYTVEFSHGVYSVQWIDLPDAKDESGDMLEQRLASERDAGVKAVDGKVIADKAIKLADKFPGRDFTADVSVASTQGQLRGRLFLVDGRLFNVLAVGKKPFLESADTTKFFDSFGLLAKPAPGA
jgi:hypothetical protein